MTKEISKMEQIYAPKTKFCYKVLVRCFTYNHSNYIQSALNGFAMQKTDFPYLCLVIDDCSTDGTQEVINNWLLRKCDMNQAERVEIEDSVITIVPHSKNYNCLFAVYFLKKNLYKTDKKSRLVDPWIKNCEYVALCEGDDYWIDENKLSDQYSFLEENRDYGLVHTYYNIVDSNGRSISVKDPLYITMPKRVKDGYVWHYYLTESGFIMTCTVMYRTSCADRNEKSFIDHGLFMKIARRSKVFCIRRNTTAYRYLQTGAMRSNGDAVQQSVRNASFMQLYYLYKNHTDTLPYYFFCPKVFLHIEYFFSKYLINMKKISVFDKYKILLKIIAYNPLLILFSPIAILIGMFKVFTRKLV